MSVGPWAQVLGRDIESIYRANDAGVLDEVQLLQAGPDTSPLFSLT